LNAGLADRFQNPQGSQSGDVARVFGHVEAYPNMTLRAQVINFVGADGGQQIHDLAGYAQIAEMQK